MADEQGKKKEGEELDPKPGENQGEPGADPKNTDGKGEDPPQEPGPIPYDRFKEVNDRARSYEKRLAELEKQNEEREKQADDDRKKELRKQEKFQELAEEQEQKVAQLEPEVKRLQGELDAANEMLGNVAEAQMELVPELFRDVVAGLPVKERLEWLTANADKLGKGKPSGIPATPQGKGNADELTSEQRRRKSARTF